jgi:NTP pyrophosphatase (non-canonical NTP hydrolase)
MQLNDYQKKAHSTVQQYKSDDQENFFLGYLGLAGEAGSVLTTLKKLIRDGDGFSSFKDKLKEELGDVLWYIAAIASHYNLTLEDIAEYNLAKTSDRFTALNHLHKHRFDSDHEKRFPDSFIVNFIEDEGELFPTVKMTWVEIGGMDNEEKSLGDALTDNAKTPNFYRFHDVFHLGYIAYLGWSPVFRHLMGLKRKNDAFVLDTEDRGRPQVAEEAITLIIYNYAKNNLMLRLGQRIDTDILNMIKQIVVDLEISSVSSYQWEEIIINSYRVFHQIIENRGGSVLVSPAEYRLEYLGK